MGAPQSKINETTPTRGFDTTRRFRGNERLQVHRIDHETFYQLGLHDRGGDFEHGLVAKEHAAFREGDNITLKAPRRQVGQKRFAKTPRLLQIRQGTRRKAHLLQVLQDRSQPRRHQVRVLGGKFAHDETKRGGAILVMFEITLGHG